MDSFVKKVFEKKTDELVHIQFQKFSRGYFKDKALISARNTRGNYSIATSYEYANELVRMMAEKLENTKAKVTGVIVSTRNLKEIAEFSSILSHADVKRFAGVNQFKIDAELNGKEITKFLDASPLSFFALSFSVGESELKIKAKAPKSAKPSTKSSEDQKPQANFCKLITKDKEIAKALLFDINLEGFKKAEITHDFIINEIIPPQGEKDFARIREMAKRKGKILRKIDVDGMKSEKEAEFTA